MIPRSNPMSPTKRTSASAESHPTPESKSPRKRTKASAKSTTDQVPLLSEPVLSTEVPSEPSKPTPRSKAKRTTRLPEPSTVSEPVLPPLAASLLRAIQDGRAIELVFQDANAHPPRTFEPRQLIYDTLAQAWFVWGWDRRYNAERHHRVDALAEVNPVEGVGRGAQGPYPEATPSNQIGGWRGGEPISVKAILLKQWTFAIRQAPPAFPDFNLVDLEDGKAQVTFTGTDLRAIARWCMQFGDGIQILEPQRLVDRIKQVGIVWGGRPTPPPPPKPEPKSEPRRPEPRREEPKKDRDSDEPRSKPSRLEVRIERL